MQPQTAISGRSVRFSTQVSGLPQPQVFWYKDSEVLSTSYKCKFLHDGDEHTLLLLEVFPEDAGEYSCTVSNRFAEERTFAVTGKRPEFTKTIESLQRQEGAQGVFSYTVTGDPLPEVQWLKGTSHIQPSGFCIIVNNPDGSGFINIKSVKQEHSGIYTCKASNQYGEASSGTAECHTELCVIDKPNFVRPLGSVAAVVGAALHLECQVDEDTGVTVSWTRDGRKVHQSPDCKLLFEDKTVTLDILKTTLKDCGNYVCTVANEAGSASCSTTVKVQGKSYLVKFQGNCSICNFCKSAVLEVNTVQFSGVHFR
uniref:Ig-like domain-containing protein n=1 Tax=Pundamilia nyererei TaxID=303518 RepID=A0A3B4H6U3_9CICH